MEDPRVERLTVLDSPQLELMAPELVPLRDQLADHRAREKAAGCSSCAQKQTRLAIAQAAIQLDLALAQAPALADVVQFLIRAQQVTA